MSKKTYIILYSLGIISSISIMFLSLIPYDFMVIFIVLGIFGVMLFSYLIYLEAKGYKKPVDYKEDSDDYETLDLNSNPENPNKFYRASIKWLSVKKGGLEKIPSKVFKIDIRIANDNIYHKAIISNYYFPLKRQTQSIIRIEENIYVSLNESTPIYLYVDNNLVAIGQIICVVCNKG